MLCWAQAAALGGPAHSKAFAVPRLVSAFRMLGCLRIFKQGIGVNFLIENWYLILLALGSGAMLMMPAMKNVGGGTLSPANAVALINREKAVVVDVSEPDAFAAGHVTGAKNIPLAQLEERLPGAVKNKALPLILVCASGKRAQSAVAVAQKLGYTNVQAVSGGMKGWRAAEMPVKKA